MIIDGHTHISTDNKNPIGNVENLFIEMKRAGVDKVIAFPLSDDFGANRKLIEQTKNKPEVIPIAFINPLNPNMLEELKESIEVLGMIGVKIHPTLSNFDVNDEKLNLLYDYCDKKNLNVIIHCTSDDEKVSAEKIEKIARSYKKATFQLAHMGAIWNANQAIEVAKRNENIFLDTGIASFNAIRRAINEVPDKVIMGCDFPFYLFEIEIMKIKRAVEYSIHDNKEEVLRKVLGENCMNLYQIKEEYK